MDIFAVLLIVSLIVALFGATAWAIDPGDATNPASPDGMAVQRLVDRLKADPRIKVLAVYADRVSIDITKAIIEKDSIIKKYLRAKQPEAEHAAYMAKSVEQTKGMLYWPLVYASADEPPKYYMVDGEQRLNTVAQDGHFIAFVRPGWGSIKEAMKDAVSANAARTPPEEEDVLAILSSGELTIKEVADRTGMDESKIGRLNKIADQPWVWPIVKANVIGIVMAGKLVEACKGNPDKLAALKNTLEGAYKAAEAEAKHWTDLINRNPNYDAKAKDRRKITHYFDSKEWPQWKDALEAGRIEQRDGKWFIILDKTTKKIQGVWMGNDKDWEEKIAFHGMFGSKVDEIDTDDLKKYLQAGGYADQIRERIETHLKRRMKAEAATEHPMPKENPVTEVTAPDEPKPQQTGFDVEN